MNQSMVRFLTLLSLFIIPFSAFADGHNLDGLIVFVGLIGIVFVIPILSLTFYSIYAFFKSRKASMVFHSVFFGIVFSFYAILIVIFNDFIFDENDFMLVAFICFIVLLVLNFVLWLLRFNSNRLTLSENTIEGEIKQQTISSEKLVLLFMMIWFGVYIVNYLIYQFIPDWYTNKMIKYLQVLLNLMSGVSFFLLVKLIKNNRYKIIAVALISIGLLISLSYHFFDFQNDI
jgi:hypothetical protein